MSQWVFLRSNADFFRVWLGSMFSSLGDRMFIVILPVWLYEISGGSSQAVALGTIVQTLAIVLFGLFGGVVVDRARKRVLLIGANVLAALLLVPAAAVSESFEAWGIFVLTFLLLGLGRVVMSASLVIVQAVVKREDLIVANSLRGIMFSASLMLGPIFASYALLVGGYRGVLIACLVGYAVFAFLSLGLQPDVVQQKAQKKGPFYRELRAGWEIVRGDRTLWGGIVFLSFFMMASGIFTSLFYVFIKEVMHEDTSMYALAMTMQGVGNVVAGFFIAGISRRFASHRLVAAMLAVITVCELSFLLVPNGMLLLAVSPVMGMAQQIAIIVAGTIFQNGTPMSHVGRVIGIRLTVTNLTITLAASLGAALLAWFGVREILFLCCVLLALSALCGYLYVREPRKEEAVVSGTAVNV